ncbi:MAG: hypothetical protein KKD08_01680 [Alphaproteobacteria bacterium]|nr:hypothetical protein [Alphaproteobacteria bacterium]
MTLRRGLLALGALGSAVSLTGCVAMAIPLAAGTLMATSSKTNGGTRAQAAAKTARIETVAVLDAAEAGPGALSSAAAGASAEADVRLAPKAAAAGTAPVRTETSTGLTVIHGPLPAPTRATDRIVAGFLAHALDQAQRNPVLTPRQSALLAEPDLLTPERMECGGKPPAAILDLDPGKESFDPLVPAAGNPRLAAALAELRERDVTVFWTSHLGAGFEDALRSVLAQTGLDPQGRDRLLLLRSLDERKHTRRTEIAQTHCVVAILGDQRADFDELFHYLRQPDTALRLDAMLGKGWFLADPIPAQIIGDE